MSDRATWTADAHATATRAEGWGTCMRVLVGSDLYTMSTTHACKLAPHGLQCVYSTDHPGACVSGIRQPALRQETTR